jgi:hypothetical protein
MKFRHAEIISGIGFRPMENVRVRWVGHELFAEADITADCDLNLAVAHALAEEAHQRLLRTSLGWPQATIQSSSLRPRRDHHAITTHHFQGHQRVASFRPLDPEVRFRRSPRNEWALGRFR